MEYIPIKDLSEKDIGKSYYVVAQVSNIRQTSGPTVFELRDSTDAIKATGFLKAGERAFPQITIGDRIQAKVIVRSRQNNLELEISSYEKINEGIIVQDISKKDFMISSVSLEQLREDFIKAAELITRAVQESRPIIVRHHDDVDGYAAGIALEKAIRPLTEKTNTEKSYLYFSRNVSRTPFYDYTDALRDLNSYFFIKSRYELKPPLIILADIGSNSQSIKAINRLRLQETSFIIIDHHRFDKENMEAAACFLNPLSKRLSPSINAGALASELAMFINPNLERIGHFPALSGTADKSRGEEYEEYVKLSGYQMDFLEKWANAIDHELFHLRFQESPEMLDLLFFPGEVNSRIIESSSEIIGKELGDMRKVVESYLEKISYRKFALFKLDRSKLGGYWGYASAKLPRIAHDLGEGSRITVVIAEDSMGFRAENVEGFSVVAFMEMLKQIPGILVEGGGHDNAGNIRFNSGAGGKAGKLLQEYLEKLDSG